jgi:acyl dehydratase
MARVFRTLEELEAAVGDDLGSSEWLRIDQERVDGFAQATGDTQWIHVDPVRAADGPFGTTVAHGYLTLALLPVLVGGLVDYAGWAVKVNYGSDKVRFPLPVRVGSSVRANASIGAVRTTAAGVQVTTRVTVEVRDPGGSIASKPALVAETLTLLVPNPAGANAPIRP